MSAGCQVSSVPRSDHARSAVCALVVVYEWNESRTDTNTTFQNVHSGEEGADIACFLLNIVQDTPGNASKRTSESIAPKESKLRTDAGKVCQKVSFNCIALIVQDDRDEQKMVHT